MRSYLIIIVLILVILTLAKHYFTLKQEVLQNYLYITKLEKKIKDVLALKQKYNKNKLNILRKYCTINNKEKIYVSCILNKSSFYEVNNLLFNGNFELRKFEIKKIKDKVEIKAEIK